MSMRGKSSGKMPPSCGMNAAGQRPAYPQEIDISHIGRRLRDERRRVRCTQEEVAEAVGLTPAFIGHIERGERSLSLDTLIKLCNYYGVTIDYLLADMLPVDCGAASEQICAMLRTLPPEKQSAALDIMAAVVRNL